MPMRIFGRDGRLSSTTQRQADKAYEFFCQNPAHPSLRFKPLQGGGSYYSVRVGDGYRAVVVRDGDVIIWFWMGTHNDFD